MIRRILGCCTGIQKRIVFVCERIPVQLGLRKIILNCRILWIRSPITEDSRQDVFSHKNQDQYPALDISNALIIFYQTQILSSIPGRSTGYPALPPQTRTSGIPAYGSSIPTLFYQAGSQTSTPVWCITLLPMAIQIFWTILGFGRGYFVTRSIKLTFPLWLLLPSQNFQTLTIKWRTFAMAS